MADPVEAFRLKLVEQVRGVFNDTASGQEPVSPSDNALYSKDTPIRMVHADIVGMMVPTNPRERVEVQFAENDRQDGVFIRQL